MRPVTTASTIVRHAEFGGPRPLICVPLVAADRAQLLQQATFAHSLAPDVVEWRADSFDDLSFDGVVRAARAVREVLDHEALIFTLRASSEGGAKSLAQDVRLGLIQAAIACGDVDIVDLELSNGREFLAPLTRHAHAQKVRVILSFHDFTATPGTDALLATVSDMVSQGADIAKVACMPREPGDVLRLLEVTLAARRKFPSVPLCTMSIGNLGVLTRAAGFLFGSDMSFAVGTAASAPGQIPIGELRVLIEALQRYA
jgi:3-dehydroquinate dehydratase I